MNKKRDAAFLESQSQNFERTNNIHRKLSMDMEIYSLTIRIAAHTDLQLLS